jgi:lipopolysaccharide transport system permease protein
VTLHAPDARSCKSKAHRVRTAERDVDLAQLERSTFLHGGIIERRSSAASAVGRPIECAGNQRIAVESAGVVLASVVHVMATAQALARRTERAREADASAPHRPVTVIRPARSSWADLPGHLRRLPEYADLLYTLTAHRISVRYRQTALGIVWAVLQPLLMMLIFTGVFSVLARMPSDGAPYPLFAYTALLPWTFLSTALTNATGSLVSHTQLITRVYFPREILPLTYLFAALFDLAIGVAIFGVLVAWYDVALTREAWNLLPVVLLLAAWTLALSLILSAAQVRWRDVGVGLPLALQFWLFASPVIYPLSAVPEGWRGWYMLNPMAGIVSAFRDGLLHGVQPDPVPLRYAVGVTACALPLAYLFFKRAEATMADVI